MSPETIRKVQDYLMKHKNFFQNTVLVEYIFAKTYFHNFHNFQDKTHTTMSECVEFVTTIYKDIESKL